MCSTASKDTKMQAEKKKLLITCRREKIQKKINKKLQNQIQKLYSKKKSIKKREKL